MIVMGVGAACRPVALETNRHAVGLCVKECWLALTASALAGLLSVAEAFAESAGAPLPP